MSFSCPSGETGIEGGVKAEEITGTSCHSVDQVVKLGSKEVEQLVEIDMEG